MTSQIAMVECGLGVTIVPAAAAGAHPAVRFRPFTHPTSAIELTAMTRTDPHPPARLLTDFAIRSTRGLFQDRCFRPDTPG